MGLDKIKEVLEKIREKNNGALLPLSVVDAARPDSSPLHSRFEWDDGVAAEKHRIWQARELIRIVVTTVKHDKKDYTVRTYISLVSDRNPEGGYRLITDVLGNESSRAEMLKNALDELRIFRTKYSQLKELSGIFEEIDNIQQIGE